MTSKLSIYYIYVCVRLKERVCEVKKRGLEGSKQPLSRSYVRVFSEKGEK